MSKTTIQNLIEKGTYTVDATSKGCSLKLNGHRLFNYSVLKDGSIRLKLRSAVYADALKALVPNLQMAKWDNAAAGYSIYTATVTEEVVVKLLSQIKDGADRVTHYSAPKKQPKKATTAKPAGKGTTKKQATTKR